MIVRDQRSSLFCGVVNGVGNKFCIGGLYYKHMKIVNDDSSIVYKLEDLLTDDAIDIIYDRRMFIIQATAVTENVFYTGWLLAPNFNISPHNGGGEYVKM